MAVLSTQAASFVRLIAGRLPTASSVDDAASFIKADIESIMGPLVAEQRADFEAAVEEVRKTVSPVEILRANSFFLTREPWYKGPTEYDRQWPALRRFLIDSKGWSPETVDDRIGVASSEIVSLLENPAQATFACRGLVIGHVQSGKTANMTAVIAKAVDAGYNLVIILAGITNKLRRQTQGRMEADLVERLRQHWTLQTTNDEKGDFRMPANGGFSDPAPGHVQLAVVKKNVAPLGQLLKTLDRTLPITLNRLKVLVIDDEADQASINTASGEFDLTKINEKIRLILKKLPAHCYVGYTATPFANVLINPYADGGRELDDLYPKDFITALPTPDGYFGTERLFGRDPIDAGDPASDEEGLDVIRSIPEEEVAALQPRRRVDKDDFQPQLPDSLRHAILYFLASCAVRQLRGQQGEHMSMLVHTSAYVIMHEKMADLIKAWLEVNDESLRDVNSPISREMKTVWDAEQRRVPDAICKFDGVDFNELHPWIGRVLDGLEVPVENGLSSDRIDYEGPPKTYIVVGGSILARGLTIEGLSVSYFLRTSNQYDTLLQMGRWFGYRPGYEDLPRIWMTDQLATNFRALAAIELEIRKDVAEYAAQQVTPMEFAVRVRSIPGLAITAASKMRAATTTDVSYSGKHVQTIRFDHRDAETVAGNWTAAGNLLTSITGIGLHGSREDRTLYEGVPTRLIVQFLRNYSVQSSHKELSAGFLLGFIETMGEAMKTWNVGVVEPNRGGPSQLGLGPIGQVKLSTRTRLQHPVDFADIKALMSRTDVLFDCREKIDPRTIGTDWTDLKRARAAAIGDIPLLLLYPIDRNSQPARDGGQRVPLGAIGDLIGIGIVFPGSADGAGRYVSVQLEPASADELDEMEAESIEQLEAGRVI